MDIEEYLAISRDYEARIEPSKMIIEYLSKSYDLFKVRLIDVAPGGPCGSSPHTAIASLPRLLFFPTEIQEPAPRPLHGRADRPAVHG